MKPKKETIYNSYLKQKGLVNKIVNFLDQEEKSYPTEIAENVETSFHSTMNYIRALTKYGFLKKLDKDARKQYYTLNQQKLDELKELEEKKSELENKLEITEKEIKKLFTSLEEK